MFNVANKYLVTTDHWFYAPDGRKYRAAWGRAITLPDSLLGVKTNRGSTNWYLSVGSGSRKIYIAGCQIHYAIVCPDKPYTGTVEELLYGDSASHVVNRPTEIYIAEVE